MNEQGRRGSETGGSTGASHGGAVQRSAGKSTRTASLSSAHTHAPAESASDVPMGALQFSMASSAPAAPSAPHDDPFGLHLEGSAAQATAARGVESGGGALPHLDTIQRSFGKHDVSGISAHTGGHAADAAGALGAEAYATGNSVAFGSSPSLHTAAHEAAHVVQQRAGVSLKGGVGESGDVYEQHADRVADAVVAGQSAEALLDRGPSGGASAGPAIQKKDGDPAPKPGATTYDPAADPDVQAAEGDTQGDELRKAVLAAARKRLAEKTEIVSAEAIEDKRQGNVTIKLTKDGSLKVKLPLDTPMKNFTTCIEFAGQTFRDGAKATGDDAKEDQQLSRGLPTFMLLFNKEVELNLMLESFQKTINQWQAPEGEVPADPKKMKSLDRAKYDRDQHAAKAEALKETLPSEEEAKNLDAKGKAELKNTQQRIKAEEQAMRQLDGNIAFIQKKVDEFEAKIVKATEDKATISGLNDAYMRADEQIPAGKRPKLGEYVLSGAAGSQPYFAGGKQENSVTLQKGMFKHIAVFNGIGEGKGLPTDGPWEEWKTIDGGSIEPVGKSIWVKTVAPYSLQLQAPDPSRPWESPSALLGWVDAEKLAALSKNDEAAAAAGLSKKK
ncbi:MAG TPA: DUF4157 domain-containing protein [Kofleriaceae bacterium]|nr:DUF4157 domain-containing protein [Kofleriaceae bacterium]